jgi:hypothetical protein
LKVNLKTILLFLIAISGLGFALLLFFDDLYSLIAVITDRPGMHGNINFYYGLTKAEYLKIITIRLLFALPIFIAGFTLYKNLKWKEYLFFIAMIKVYVVAFLLIEDNFLIWLGKG